MVDPGDSEETCRRRVRRRIGRVVVAALAVASAFALPASVPTVAALPTTVHVSPSAGSDRNPGTATSPVRTLARAVAMAPTGSAIVLHGGTYHESVQIFGKDLDIAAAPGESVVFDGARRITNWVSEGGRWYAPGWTNSLPRIIGDELNNAPSAAALPDLAYRNGVALRQVTSLAAVGPGTFFVDDASDRLWVGSDPTGQVMEASDLRWALWFNSAHGSSLVGVTVRRYATTKSDMAAVRLYSNSMYMADSTVSDNAYKGVSVIGRSVRLDRLTVRTNGYIGIHGHLSRNVTLIRSTVVGNNTERYDAVHSGSGVKFTTSSIVGIRNNYVADNAGVGIWTDLGTSFVSVTGNLVERNTHSGILMELSGRVVVADNVVLDNSEAGIWILETNDAEVWHNAAMRNIRDIWVEEGPRTDPSADAVVNWDLNRVNLRNNVIGQGRSGSEALVAVDDWTERRSATSMAVTSDNNAFWLPPGSPTRLARWARWPQSLAMSWTLAAHRSATGQDQASRSSSATTNPFARNAARYDHRIPETEPLGAPLNARVAAALGLTEGTRIALGPRRWMTPPTTRPGVAFRS